MEQNNKTSRINYKKMYETLLEKNNKLMQDHDVLSEKYKESEEKIESLAHVKKLYYGMYVDSDKECRRLDAQVKYYKELLIKTLHHFVSNECFIGDNGGSSDIDID